MVLKSVALVPYCPLPADTGGKTEIWKYLGVLGSRGPCTILSASSRPVGAGWSGEQRREIERRGFTVRLREEGAKRLSPRQRLGLAFGAFCKGLGMERAFGHSNPYHRHAFPARWWFEHTREADLAVIHYSYWSWLPCACPKVVALLDLWSDVMWEGPGRETADLKGADLVSVISVDEEIKLKKRGISNTHWSPPLVERIDTPVTDRVGLVGSGNRFNREGLKWLSGATRRPEGAPRIYGSLSRWADKTWMDPLGRYDDPMKPYRDCGILLMTTVQGMGVQIKTIEALAAGRAIVARRGAMRGIPPSAEAWIEVDTPTEMSAAVSHLQKEGAYRERMGRAAHAYYEKHLQAGHVVDALVARLEQVAANRRRTGRPAWGEGAIRG